MTDISLYHQTISLPTYYQIICYYCYYNDTIQKPCGILYDKFYESAFCIGNPTFPVIYKNKTVNDPTTDCINKTTKSGPILTSRCNMTHISPKTFTSWCTDTFSNQFYSYKCSYPTKQGRWRFYPGTHDFSSYREMIVFLLVYTISWTLTIVVNVLLFVVLVQTKQIRTSKTIIYITHMIWIDLFICFLVMPVFFLIVFNHNHYLFKGVKLVSNMKFFSDWFDQTHLFFLNLSFTNMAVMSAERFISVFFPFYHMAKVTQKRIIFSLPCIWLYGASLSVIQHFTLGSFSIYILFTLSFVAPTLITIATYLSIIFKINMSRFTTSIVQRNTRQKRVERNITINLLVVATVFILCWLPYLTIGFIYYSKVKNNESVTTNFLTVFRWLQFLTFFHCFLDATLYSMPRPNIRRRIAQLHTSVKTTDVSSKGGQRVKDSVIVNKNAFVMTPKSEG